ncbi:hypothetical protein HYT92_03315 [Candidatus Pacearchaeota archaeon]|nr:hypothetical protein [Candidatus Pacearchaeota archaeon]
MEETTGKDGMVYSNMIDLLLEYGNKTESEIVESAIERFGFPRLELEHSIMPLLAEKLEKGYVEKYKADGRYHLLDIDFSSKTGRVRFAGFLSESPLCLDNPHMKKLKQAFEERGFILK